MLSSFYCSVKLEYYVTHHENVVQHFVDTWYAFITIIVYENLDSLLHISYHLILDIILITREVSDVPL